MNRHAMPRLAPAIVAAVLFAVSACSPRGSEAVRPPLEGASIGGDFTLIDKAGKPVRFHDFARQYRIVYFGYTFCPDACPTDVGVIIQGLARFAKKNPGLAADIQPFFITIDPARDTPAKVGQFAAAFSPKLIGLTGSQAEIDALAAKFVAIKSKGRETPGGYLMEHTRHAYLLGRNGEPIEILPVFDGPDAVAADLAKSVH